MINRFPWILLFLFLTIAPAGAQPEEQEGAEQKKETPLFFEEEFKIGETVKQIATAMTEAKTESAVQLLQQLTAEHGAKLHPIDGVRAAPLWRRNIVKIAEFSAATRTQYADAFNAPARVKLDRALKENDWSDVEACAKEYFHTEAGVAAAEMLAGRCIEQGDLVRACLWTRLLAEDGRSERLPLLLARLADLAVGCGEPSVIGRVREAAERRSLSAAKISIDGHPVELARHLDECGKRSPAPRHASDLPPSAIPKMTAWSTEIEGGEKLYSPSMPPGYLAGSDGEGFVYILDDHGGYHRVRSGTGSNMGRWPFGAVAVDGRLWVNFTKGISIIDPATGDETRAFGGERNRRKFLESLPFASVCPRFFMVSGGGRVFATVDCDNRTILVTLDAKTGDLLWRSDRDPAGDAYKINGVPFLMNDLLLIGATPKEKPDEVHLLSLEAATGKLLWDKFLTAGGLVQGGAGGRGRGQDLAIAPTLAAFRGVAICCTNRGVVVALDAATGEFLWAHKYGAGPGKYEWRHPPILIDGGRAIVAPADDGVLLALDLFSGELLRTRSRGECRDILGLRDGVLYLGGREVLAVDAESFKLRWSWEIPRGAYTGSALLTGDAVLVPTTTKMVRLDLSNGDVRDSFAWKRPDEAGSLHIAGDRLISVGERRVTAYTIR